MTDLVSALASQDAPLREVLERDEAAPGMGHIPSVDPGRHLCGARRQNPGGPPSGWGRDGVECVVCDGLWLGLPSRDRDAITDASLARERAARRGR